MIDFRFNYPVLDSVHQDLTESLHSLQFDNKYLRLTPPEGDPEDRGIAAEWLSKPDYQIKSDSVFIACGGHHAVMTIIIAAGLSGKSVLVDALTYNGFIASASMLGVNLIPCPIDEHGIVPSEIAKLCQSGNIAAIYLMPTIHNPLCYIMPLSRRIELVEVARQFDLTIIDDDAYGFLAPEAPVSFAHLAPERAFFIYSFAKVIAPGVKTSYIVVPEKWKNSLSNAIRMTSSGPVILFNHIIGSWIESGKMSEMIGEKRRLAGVKQRIVQEVLAGHRYITQPTSYHFWLPFPESTNAFQFGEGLIKKGVEVVTSQAYQIVNDPKHSGIRIALGNVPDENTLRKGLTIISESLKF